MNNLTGSNHSAQEDISGKRSLSRILFILPMSAAIISVLALTMYIAVSDFRQYLKGNESLKKEFPKQQRHELMFRVLAAKDYIHFVRTHPAESINTYINKRLNIATSILSEGVGIGAGNSLNLTPIASDTLALLFNESSIGIAVAGADGKLIFASDRDAGSVLEQSSLWKHIQSSDKSSTYQLQDAWKQLSGKRNSSPSVFAGPITTNSLILYALINPGDSVKLMQELVLDSLARIRFEHEEYIFINTYDGQGLITNGLHQRKPLKILNGNDTNWMKVFAKELEYAAKPGGGFHTYYWKKDEVTGYTEKISYFSGIEDWKWIIGTGMHTNEVMPLLKERERELKKQIINEFLKLVAFLVLLIAAIYFISKYISKLTSANIRIFIRFLRNAAIGLQPVDENKVHFREFQTLAKAANHMINERNKIQSDLTTEQSRLKYIIDSIPDLVFFKDIDSRFIGCNHAFEKFIGKKADDIIGRTEYDLFSKTNADSYIESDKRLLETLEPVRTTEWATYPDGHKVLCYTLKTLYFDENGKVLGFIGISRDITELEETRQRLILAKEKAEESDRLKTAFLANMSHEIRTPMNAIIGFSDLLADEELDKEDRDDFISKIKLSGESLMNIINDIIDIAKIEAGQLKITDAECNVDKLLADLYGTFLEIIKRNKKDSIEILLSYPEQDTPLMTITDPLRLHQVLTNLLSNALKFTEFGKIEFGYNYQDSNIHFFVRDTGIGILRSKQSLLFQRFSQVDPGSTRKYGGTGLGLAICKNIVDLLGGTIWMESEPGQGSTFHFTIPFRKVSLKDDPTTPDSPDNWKDKTILVAEDVEQNYMLIEAILRFTQVSMMHAPNGQAAIDMVKENPAISLVLMDIQLPIKTGYEAIHEILQFKPEMPIISFTAYALPREKEKSLDAGCVDFLNKPIKPDHLIAVLRKYLK